MFLPSLMSIYPIGLESVLFDWDSAELQNIKTNFFLTESKYKK